MVIIFPLLIFITWNFHEGSYSDGMEDWGSLEWQRDWIGFLLKEELVEKILSFRQWIGLVMHFDHKPVYLELRSGNQKPNN